MRWCVTDANSPVGDGETAGVHGFEHIALHQGGQPQVLGGKLPVGIVGGHAPCVRRGPGIHVDADEDVGPGHVGAHVTGRDIVVDALDCQQPARHISAGEPDYRRRPSPRHHHPVPPGAQECHGVQLDAQVHAGLVNNRTAGGGADGTGVEPAVPGVEEHRPVIVAVRRPERHARTGTEQRRADRRAR